jgi:hypothetical protein
MSWKTRRTSQRMKKVVVGKKEAGNGGNVVKERKQGTS